MVNYPALSGLQPWYTVVRVTKCPNLPRPDCGLRRRVVLASVRLRPVTDTVTIRPSELVNGAVIVARQIESGRRLGRSRRARRPP